MKNTIIFTYFLLLALTRLTAQGTQDIPPNSQSFTHQPGAIKSITTVSKNQWLLQVDLLTPNPDWKPGIDSTGPFFLNPDPAILTLTIDAKTLTYRCGDTSVLMPGKTPEFMTYIQNYIENIIGDAIKHGAKSWDYTAYFTITASHIDAITEQCLP